MVELQETNIYFASAQFSYYVNFRYHFQLCDLGAILYPKNSDKIDEMMDELRRRLLASDTLSSSRVLFLEALECYAGGWEADDSAVDYYKDKKTDII